MIDVMILVMICLLFVGCILVYMKSDDLSSLQLSSMIGTVVFGLSILVYSLQWSVNIVRSKEMTIWHDSIENTLQSFRANDEPLERTAIFGDIIKFNNSLAEMQYWNKNGFDTWYLDEIDTLKPIK